MAPSELLESGGAIEYWYYNDTPGIAWLRRLKKHFKYSVWLNPLPKRAWMYNFTARAIAEVFPMFELTLQGLDDAIKTLLKGDGR